MSEEQEPVSKELWYQQNAMIKDTIKEIKADLKETKADIKSISESVEKILIQTTATNGRVNKLESDTSEVKNYSTDKARLWGGVGVLLVVGGAVITLSIMAINSKIKEGYTSPEVRQFIQKTISESVDSSLEARINEIYYEK